jgi:hypothetical protein
MMATMAKRPTHTGATVASCQRKIEELEGALVAARGQAEMAQHEAARARKSAADAWTFAKTMARAPRRGHTTGGVGDA